MVYSLYAHDLCKNAKNRMVISFLYQTLCEIAVQVKEIRINGTSVADGWAGAVMQKLLAIQKCYGRTDPARCRVAHPRQKKNDE